MRPARHPGVDFAQAGSTVEHFIGVTVWV